jgi:hypothetical protein
MNRGPCGVDSRKKPEAENLVLLYITGNNNVRLEYIFAKLYRDQQHFDMSARLEARKDCRVVVKYLTFYPDGTKTDCIELREEGNEEVRIMSR